MQINSEGIVRQRGGDYLVLMVLVPVICVARVLCESFAEKYYLTRCAQAEPGQRLKKSKVRVNAKKFRESFWKFAYYGTTSLFGLFFLSWEDYIQKPFENYPGIVNSKIYWYYMMQIAFYLWMSLGHIWDVRRKDFYQMAAHHGFTLILLILSYTYSLVNAGSLILILHDLADPFLEAAKMLIYLKKELISTASFACFMITFLTNRLYFFPRYCMFPAMSETYDLAVSSKAMTVYYAVNGSLVALLCLNVFWSVLIVKVLLKKVQGNGIRDNRSDDESD